MLPKQESTEKQAVVDDIEVIEPIVVEELPLPVVPVPEPIVEDEPEQPEIKQSEEKEDMIIHFSTVIDKLLTHEGGYVNDPKDPGGETNFGISKKSFPNVNIAGLTLEQAKQIYFDRYWKGNNIDLLPQHLRYIVFDTAVNMGGRTAVIMLQKLIGVNRDGRIGPMTAKAAQNLPIGAYANARIMRYNFLVARNGNLKKFLRGWKKRVNDVVAFTQLHFIQISN